MSYIYPKRAQNLTLVSTNNINPSLDNQFQIYIQKDQLRQSQRAKEPTSYNQQNAFMENYFQNVRQQSQTLADKQYDKQYRQVQSYQPMQQTDFNQQTNQKTESYETQKPQQVQYIQNELKPPQDSLDQFVQESYKQLPTHTSQPNLRLNYFGGHELNGIVPQNRKRYFINSNNSQNIPLKQEIYMQNFSRYDKLNQKNNYDDYKQFQEKYHQESKQRKISINTNFDKVHNIDPNQINQLMTNRQNKTIRQQL